MYHRGGAISFLYTSSYNCANKAPRSLCIVLPIENSRLYAVKSARGRLPAELYNNSL